MDLKGNLTKDVNVVDSCADILGRYLATGSLDGMVIVHSINSKSTTLDKVTVIKTPSQKPIWRVKWADPRFGAILAFCSFDHCLYIYELKEGGKEEMLFSYTHRASLNDLDFGPWGVALKLVTVGSDGRAVLITRDNSSFTTQATDCHSNIATAVSFAPACSLKNFLNPQENSMGRQLFATGGCDGRILIWEISRAKSSGSISKGEVITLFHSIDRAHSPFVRTLSWSSNSALGYHMLASGGEDKICKIWKLYFDPLTNEKRDESVEVGSQPFQTAIWRVSWNYSGNLLAVGSSLGDGTNVLQVFHEVDTDRWEPLPEQKS